MTGQQAGLGGHALHQVPIAALHDGPVINQREVLGVKPGGQQPLGHGHPHRVGHSLAQRTGGDLHPGQQPRSGWPAQRDPSCRNERMIRQSDVVAGQMQRPVEHHGRMPTGEHEPISIRPGRIEIGRVVTKMAGV